MKLNTLPKAGEMLAVDALGFDSFEIGTLAVTRHFLINFDAPERQSWQTAFAIAQERWGFDIGLTAAYKCLKLVKALRHARADFSYNDPLCADAKQLVTADETHLMRMLHHMRRDQTSDARDAVEALTLGQMDPHVIRTGLALAHRFGAGAATRRTRPVLHVVS